MGVSTDLFELSTVTSISSFMITVALMFSRASRSTRCTQNEEDIPVWTTDAKTNMPPASTRREDHNKIVCEETNHIGRFLSVFSGREGRQGSAYGRLFVKDPLREQNRRSRQWLSEVVIFPVCRKRCRNLFSLRPNLSSFARHTVIQRRANDGEFVAVLLPPPGSHRPFWE